MMRREVIGGATLYCGDCREVLPGLSGVDACVTDPPYGIGAARNRDSARHGWTDFGVVGWDDKRPPEDLLRAVFALGHYQIVWGGNYFLDLLAPATKWLIWDKGQTDFSLADAELAWCSWPGAIRRILYPRSLALQDGKEHQTQKALRVMEWCLIQLPSGVDTICDPFMGSGTTGVACAKFGRRFIGVEIHEPYFDIACRRIEAAYRQRDLFVAEPPRPAASQATLFGGKQ